SIIHSHSTELNCWVIHISRYQRRKYFMKPSLHSYKPTGIKTSEVQLDYFSQLIIKIVQLEDQFLDNNQVSKFPIYALISDQKSMGTC
ncbi:unnamed protein product, partial [Bubo scandiacus]